ncbi:MAG: hypothetical protein WDN44_11070 [Sphingomonas sp.]
MPPGGASPRCSAAPEPAPLASALTIGIDTPDAMAEAAARVARAPLLKVKVDAADAPARIRAVRAAAPEARLIVDPNESWGQDPGQGDAICPERRAGGAARAAGSRR